MRNAHFIVKIWTLLLVRYSLLTLSRPNEGLNIVDLDLRNVQIGVQFGDGDVEDGEETIFVIDKSVVQIADFVRLRVVDVRNVFLHEPIHANVSMAHIVL